MAENPQYNAEDKPPPYAPPPYPGPEDPSSSAKYPPPGQGYNWQQPPPPVTEAPVQGGYPQPVQPPFQNQPGYQAQPGYQVPPGYQGQPGYPGYQPQPGYPGYPAQAGYQYPAAPAMTTTQHTNVTVMGGPNVVLAPQIAPPDYCLLSWFACLFCFFPVGLCAVLKANETRSAIYRGDMVAANRLSMETRKLANMSIAIQITIVVVMIIIRFALLAIT